MARRRTLDRDPGLVARMTMTMFLLGLIYVVFFVVLAQAFNLGLIPIIILGGGLLVVQYWTSDKIALRSAGARIVSQAEAPELHAVVQRLCMTAGLPMPRVAIVPTDMPNAFATGRSPKHAAVAVTQGLLDRLEPHELEGVIAHELSHVAHRDVAIMTMASFFAMVAGFITRWGFFFGGGFGGGDDDNNSGNAFVVVLLVSIVVYALSFVLIRTLSRYREFAADRGAAILTKSPSSLASALVKISGAMGADPAARHAHGRGPEPVLHHPRRRSRAASRTCSRPPPARGPARAAAPPRARPRRPSKKVFDRKSGRFLGPMGLFDSLLGRTKVEAPTLERLFAISTAQVTLETVARPAPVAGGRDLLQADVVVAVPREREGHRGHGADGVHRLRDEDGAQRRQYGYEWLTLTDAGLRGPRDDDPRHGAVDDRRRLRRAAPVRALRIRARERPVRLQLQARHVLSFRAAGFGHSRHRARAPASGEAREASCRSRPSSSAGIRYGTPRSRTSRND